MFLSLKIPHIDQKNHYWPFTSFSYSIWGKSRLATIDSKQKLASDIQLIIKKTAPIADDHWYSTSVYNLFMAPLKMVSGLVKSEKVTFQRIPIQLLKYYIPPQSNTFIGAKDQDLSHLHVYSSGTVSEQLSFSFGACDWHLFYELGVALALTQLFKPEILRNSVFLGSGSGSIVALAMALEMDIDKTKEAMEQVYENQFLSFASTSGVFDTVLKQVIPNEISVKNLMISMSKESNFDNILKSQFDSKQELIDSVSASCFVPLAYQSPKKVENDLVLSGLYSNPNPIKNCITITISAFGNTNICPLTCADNVNTLYSQGFDDCLEWFMARKRDGILHSLLFN